MRVSSSEPPNGSVRESISYQLKPQNKIKGRWIIKRIRNVAIELENVRNELKKLERKFIDFKRGSYLRIKKAGGVKPSRSWLNNSPI